MADDTLRYIKDGHTLAQAIVDTVREPLIVLDRNLHGVAARLGVSAQQVALAWLLQRSPTIALIPGTSSVAHLRENIAAAALELPADAVAELDAIGT